MRVSRKKLASILREVKCSIYEWEAHAFAERLDEDDLEIEGYEKSEWTIFNPNDKATWPNENEAVLAIAELYDHDAKEIYTTALVGGFNYAEGVFIQTGITNAYTCIANIKAWKRIPFPPPPNFTRIKSYGK